MLNILTADWCFVYRLTLYICIVICVLQNMAKKHQNLPETQKVDGDDGRLMRGPLP